MSPLALPQTLARLYEHDDAYKCSTFEGTSNRYHAVRCTLVLPLEHLAHYFF